MKQSLFVKKWLVAFIISTAIITLHAQEGPSSYYKTNPTLGKKSTSPVVIDGNPSEWNADMLIVQGVANDDARAFRGPHEGPVYDLYQLYATWDDANLYLLWQITNVSDIASPGQDFPHSDNGKPWNGDIPFQLAFDIDRGTGTDGILAGKTVMGEPDAHVWGIFNVFSNENVDKLLMFSSKPGVGQPAVFSPDPISGSFDYETSNILSFAAAGVEYQWGDYCVPSQIFGINKDQHSGYVTDDLAVESAYVDFIALGHDVSMNTVYEMKIPLSALGIDVAYLESTGIGVMLVSTFGQSGVNSLPFDPATIDNASVAYGPDESTSKEKEDVDMFTVPFARIGAAAGDIVVRPTLSVSPAGGTYLGGTSVTLTAAGEHTPLQIRYTLDGTAPTVNSPSIASGAQISITDNNTILKAVVIDDNGIYSQVATHTYITEEPEAPAGIKVSFLKPATWGAAGVNLWAWTGTGVNIFNGWPGAVMTEEAGGWYSYTFDEALTEVNVLFSNNGNPQSVDITGITSSTCFEQDGTMDGKIAVKTVPCQVPTTLKTPQATQGAKVYPNPARDYISISELTARAKRVTLLALDGRLVKVINNYSHQERISLSGLRSGVYLLKIESVDGTIRSARFVKW
ncbi:MAG TPA: starch-binding protein [Cyclobacteriaceae bacterium]|nr:starch-binding protein [Cyclobacteriaceae bacterium]